MNKMLSESMMSKIFLSYKHAVPDRQLAEHLVNQLERAGHHVFWDQKVVVGETWTKVLVTYLRNADFFVVLVSKASINGDFVIEEVRRAREFVRQSGAPRILPVRVAEFDDNDMDISLSVYLRNLQYVEWKTPQDNAKVVQALLKAMGMCSGAKTVAAKIAHASASAVSPVSEWSLLPADTFTMGSPKDETDRCADEQQHRARITRPFLMKRTAVTVGEYRRFRAVATPWFPQNDQHPVVYVSWRDAIEYCNWLSNQQGLARCYCESGSAVVCDFSALGYRLPTEAEWEYACRAGQPTPFHTGKNISVDQANYDGNYPYNKGRKGKYREGTVPVGSLPHNKWLLHEMHGNVLEWCWDWYNEYFCADPPPSDPCGPASGAERILRGGSWYNWAEFCRSASRFKSAPDIRDCYSGFRIVRRPPQP